MGYFFEGTTLSGGSGGGGDSANVSLSNLNSAGNGRFDAKANIGLDNLNAGGQMIIDSANGTISNCILEIPQNLKLTLENNVLTLKAGSVLTWGGDTYTTSTTTQDQSYTISNTTGDGVYLVFVSRSNGIIQGLKAVNNVLSGAESARPEASSLDNLSVYYNTDTKLFNLSNRGQNTWGNDWPVAYPTCLIQMSNGVASFAKDSKGRDMIFNGAGFIGHHAFIYPNVKALLPDKFNDDRSLKSTLDTTNSLMISDLGNTGDRSIAFPLVGAYMSGETGWGSYEELPTTHQEAWAYVTKENLFYRWSSSTSKYDQFNNGKGTYFIDAHVTNGVVTSFNLRQPYDEARYLLTDEIEEEVATKQADLTTVSGYDATKIQSLKHDANSVLTWVDDE